MPCDILYGFLYGLLSGTYSDILSGISFDILSGLVPNLIPDILPGILSGKYCAQPDMGLALVTWNSLGLWPACPDQAAVRSVSVAAGTDDKMAKAKGSDGGRGAALCYWRGWYFRVNSQSLGTHFTTFRNGGLCIYTSTIAGVRGAWPKQSTF